jgi:DNA-binding CsgD family transcriptional regulator
VDALTPSELRVARLAAGGRSNREIAGELYVTLKAIEGHLARAYAKLGIEGRSQLADAVAARATSTEDRPGKDWGADPTANQPPAGQR